MAVGEPARDSGARDSGASDLGRAGYLGHPDAAFAAPPLPVRDPGASQVRVLSEQIRALDDLEILRRVLAALRGL